MERSMILAVLVACTAGLLTSCADLQEELPTRNTGTLKVHTDGWTLRASEQFHGQFIRDNGWDMRTCWTCHGKTYEGGTSGASCKKCHTKPEGPEDCTTCHGGNNPAPPRDLGRNTSSGARGVGAHQIHLVGTTISSPVACSECHIVPAKVYTTGHVDSPGPAELVFSGSLANTVTNEPTTADYDAVLPLTVPMPSYDHQALKCSNTYCHGTFKNGASFAPIWNDVTGSQAACGTCHGDPSKPTLAERALPRTSALGGTHPNVLACSACHADVVDANLRIINPAKHINGKLNVFGQERDY